MATLQVKGIDDDLYTALSTKARRDGRSISQEVIVLIQDFLLRRTGSNQEATQEFLDLAGSWADERSPEEIIKELRKSRRNRKPLKDSGDVFD